MNIGLLAHRDYMKTDPFKGLHSIIDKLLEKQYLVVEDNNKYLGILTTEDALSNLHNLVIDCVSEKPVLNHDLKIENSLEIMLDGSFHVLAVFEKDKFCGVVTYYDIIIYLNNSKKTLEKQFEKMKQFESMGKYSAGIAHDFNNLHMAIYAHVATANLEIDSNTKISKVFKRIMKRLEDAKVLTNKLLSSTPEKIKISNVTNTSDFIRDNVNIFLDASSIKVFFNLATNLPRLSINSCDLSRIISNLVVNACQAMPDGGTLKVSAENHQKRTTDDLNHDQQFVKLIFEDSGKGIPKDMLKTLFTPGFTTKANGTGLGLAIVHSIIKKNNGDIKVSSASPKGARFEILLPGLEKLESRKDRK